MPLETMTPQRSGSAWAMSKPASARASLAAHTANWVKRSMCLDSGRVMQTRGSKSLTSAARWTFMPVGSNWVMGATPQTPSFTACQLSDAVRPTGVTAPRPVMTTLRRFIVVSSC